MYYSINTCSCTQRFVNDEVALLIMLYLILKLINTLKVKELDNSTDYARRTN